MNIALFNPFSNQYHACQDLSNRGTKWQGLGIVVASVFVGLLTLGVGGVALFRTLVGRVTKPAQPGGQKINRVTTQILPHPQKQALDAIFQATQKKFPHNSRLPKLYRFLTQASFKYDPKDYDLGFEDNFHIAWLDPAHAADRRFLEAMHQKYPAAMQKLQEADVDSRNQFELNKTTRLANNNIFGLFTAAQKKNCPEIQALLREVLTYCILRDVKLP